MDNGFLITGAGYRYIRKSGSNSNNGSTTATPKQTINGNVIGSTTNVVLAGHYVETINYPGIGGVNLVADGLVTLEGDSPSSSYFQPNYNSVSYVNGFIFLNYNIVNGNTSGANQTYYNGCRFKSINNLRGGWDIVNSEVLDCGIGIAPELLTAGFTRSILKNSNANFTNATSYITNSIVQPDCTVTLNATSLTYFKNNFKGNNFRGLVSYSGQFYVVPQAVDLIGGGTDVVSFASRTGSYPVGATDWIHNLFAITPTVCYVTNNNYNADPLFRDVLNNDFTVSASSPCIGKIALQTGRNANTGYVQVTTQLLDLSTWTLSNITNTSGVFTITSGAVGTLTSPTITINSTVARALGELNLNGGFFYNVAIAGGTLDKNENVPRIATYTKQGVTITNTNPRLCLKMRLSTKNSTPSPTVDADWDNNGYVGLDAGDWFIVEFKKPPKLDQNGYGNADNAFDVINNGFPMGKYVQFSIELRNNNTQG